MTMEGLKVIDSLRDRPLSDVLKEGGLVGAGGAGFPTWAKYVAAHPYHVTNAQESEPGYYIDKWLHKARAKEFAELYQWLLGWGVKKIIVAPKYKDRPWFEELEALTKGEVLDCRGKNRYRPDDVDNPILFTYTDDKYAFGKESALLLICGGVKIGPGERPTDHGYIVNNSQTLFNMHALLTTGRPLTRKYVHVYGETPKHVFLDAPVGTLAEDLLQAAGTSVDEIRAKGFVVVEGGPGWYEVVETPASFSLTKRTNSLLVVDPAFRDPTQKDVLEKPNQPGYPRTPASAHQQEPSAPLEPARVRVRLVDNPRFAAILPAVPTVQPGDAVTAGDVVAKAASEGFSVNQHAPVTGKITAVTDAWVEIER